MVHREALALLMTRAGFYLMHRGWLDNRMMPLRI